MMTERKEIDLSTKTDGDIETWIANHERQGATTSELYRRLVVELGHRKGRGLKVETSLEVLKSAAREGRFVSYGELAEANGVPWSKARHAMNGVRGHLDQILAWCHAHSLPLLPAICVNQENLKTGVLGPEAMRGFVSGAQRLGYVVADEEAFLRECQRVSFEWGKSNRLRK